MRLIDPTRNPILAPTTCYFGGGGRRPKSEPINIPPPPPPPPPPEPPPPPATIDMQNGQEAVQNEAAKRKGMRKSILAGESGQAPMTTGSSTLG